jgi:hypothetical protein
MTGAQIIEWCTDIGKRIAAGNVARVPLTKRQAARAEVLKRMAAEQRKRSYALVSFKHEECRREAVG